MDIDPITGLPKELVAFEDISKESLLVTISVIKKKFGKKYTIINGIDNKEIDIKQITKSLKNKFSCGGTFKNGAVELQGDYSTKMSNELLKLGFNSENIIIR